MHAGGTLARGQQVVAIPFSGFSNDWSSYTGNCDSLDPTKKQHHCCTSDHPEVLRRPPLAYILKSTAVP